MIRAAAKNHEGVAVITEPDDYAADPRRAQGRTAASSRRRPARAWRPRPSTARPHYDFVIANWFSETEGDFPSHILRDYEKVMEPQLRREPAPARRLLRRERRPPAPALARHPAPRQEALVQQPLRPARRALAGDRVRPAGLRRSSSTTTPAAARWPRSLAHAYPKALESDPVSAFGSVIAVNRHDRRRDGAAACRSCSSRCCSRPATTTRPSRSSPASPTSASWSTTSAARSARGEMDYKRVLGGVLVQDRDADLEDRESHGGRHQAPPDRGRVGRPDLRAAAWPSTSSRTPS